MKFFRRISEIIIPTVYDDALSYGQIQKQVVKVVNLLVDWVNDKKHVFSVNGFHGDVELKKLRFTGYSNQEYNGSEEVIVRIPTSPEDGVIAQLRFTGGVDGVYDGREALTVPIPDVKTVNGKTGDVVLTATDVGAVGVGNLPTTLPNPAPLIIMGGGCQEKRYDGSQQVVINVDGEGGGVQSVNGKTGVVNLNANDVGALPSGGRAPNPYPIQFTGAAVGTYDGSAPLTIDIPTGGGEAGQVVSVNGKTGAVLLNAQDVGALPDNVTTLPNPQSITFNGFSNAEYDGSVGRVVNIPNIINAGVSTENIPQGSNTYDVRIGVGGIALTGVYCVTIEGEGAANFGSFGLATQSAHPVLFAGYDPVTVHRSFLFDINSTNINTPITLSFTQPIQYYSVVRVSRLGITVG